MLPSDQESTVNDKDIRRIPFSPPPGSIANEQQTAIYTI